MELQNVKKPSDKRWLGVIAWLLVVLLGFGIAYLYNRNLELSSDNAATSTKTIAMTSNIAALKEDIAKLEREAKKTADQTVAAPVSIAEKIAKAYFVAQVKGTVDMSKYSAKLMAESGVFKRYSVGLTGEGGASVIVKKVGEDWVPVSIGQSLPSKSTGELYSMPTGWYSTEY